MNDLETASKTRRPVMSGEKLSGRVALVTGGTRGIGAAICRSLASQGAVRRRRVQRQEGSGPRSSSLRSGTTTRSVTRTVHQGNVSRPEDCRRVVDEVIAEHGRLDILVNNAGITIDKTVLNRWRLEDWDKVLAVNLSGSFFLSQAALEHMAERGTGRIVNVSSDHRRDGQHRSGQLRRVQVRPVRSDQDARQGSGLHAARRPASRTTTSIGLTVNTVTPGFVANRDARAPIPEKVMEQDHRSDPGAAGLPAGGDRPRRALPRRGCLRLHHRPGLGRQRRHGHVAASAVFVVPVIPSSCCVW